MSVSSISLRPYQVRLIHDIRNAFQSHRSVLGVLPTGGGKTTIFCEVTRRAVALGSRVLLLAHRKELVAQIASSLARVGVPHGILAPRATVDHARRVQLTKLGSDEYLKGDESLALVGSVQSVAPRAERLRTQDLVVVDEAHHATRGSYWGRCLESWPEARQLLVTATPSRLDGRGLGVDSGGFAETIVEGPQMAELISQGFLSPYRAFGTGEPPDLEAVRSRAGDFRRGELELAVSKPKLLGNAVEHYLKHASGRPAVAFCVSIAHARMVAEEFTRASIPADFVSGAHSPNERSGILDRFEAGELSVLCSADLIGEGLDIPRIGAAILLRPTQSLGLYLQQVGRVLRISPGKREAIILDHAGNIARHGFPDDERRWTLDGKMSRNRPNDATTEPGITTCEQCFTIYSAAIDGRACPSCKAEPPQKEITPRVLAGELREIERKERREAFRAARIAQGRADTVESLLRLPHVRNRFHAQKILEAREKKKALVEALRLEIQAWDEEHKRDFETEFGVKLARISQMKPKELTSILDRIKESAA